MIDQETGLRYCADEQFYHEMLGDFVDDSYTRLKTLKSSFEKEDWNEYKKAVHTLKSLSMTIGAINLSNASKKHQYSVINGNTNFIAEDFDDLIREYRTVIREACNIIDRLEF